MSSRSDWEERVFQEIERMGEVTRSDAQALVEAEEMQGNDVLAIGWELGQSAQHVAALVLDLTE